MKEITSKDNPAIKQVLRLKQKKYRWKEKCYIVEGHKMLDEILTCPQGLVKVFLTQEYAIAYGEVLRKHRDIECLLVNDRLMALISETEQPQGVLALVKMPQSNYFNIIQKERLLLLLDHIQDPGNMGTIIRTSWAFAVDGILLSPDCADPFSPKAVRASMGGILHVPVFCDTNTDILNDFLGHGYQIIASLPEARDNIFTQDFTGRKIIVIGNESRGVSTDIKKLCTSSFKIPLNPDVDSLNAAIACAIITMEALRQRDSCLNTPTVL